MDRKVIRIFILLVVGAVCLGMGILSIRSFAAFFTQSLSGTRDSAAAQSNGVKNFDLIAQAGGDIYSLDAQDNLVYMGIGQRLVISDFTDPANPVIVGRTDMLPAGLKFITVAQDYVYAISYDYLLRVFNVTDPAQPVEIATFGFPAPPEDLAISGGYAYVALYKGLEIIDISNPAHPKYVGDFPISNTNRVVNNGSYLSVASWDGITILNISDPVHPVQKGFYKDDSPGYLAISGSYLYSADNYTGLTIIDISDPSTPFQLSVYPWGELSTGYFPEGISLAGKYAFIINDNDGLLVINVADPSEPVKAGSLYIEDPSALKASGPIAYVLATQGVFAVGLTVRARPVAVGSYEPPQIALGVATSDTYAYVTFNHGLNIYDVSDPITPTLVGSTPTKAYDIALSGNYAYVGGCWQGCWGIEIINITDPANPFPAGNLHTGLNYYSGLVASGSYLYGVSGTYIPHYHPTSHIEIFDITDPVNITRIATYYSTGLDHGVAISGTYAYIAVGKFDDYSTYIGGLHVVDVSNPSSPVKVAEYTCEDELGGGGYGIAIDHSYAYLGCTEGLYVLDVSDPSYPYRIGYLGLPNSGGRQIKIVGHYVYLSGNGSMVIDISDPTRPVEVGYHPAWGDISILSGDLYVAAQGSGLEILRLTHGSISGQVTDLHQNSIMGVTILASFGLSATTGMDGSYLLNDLPPASYTMTPTLPGYAFWPPLRTVVPSYSSDHQDFTLLPLPVTITLTPGLTSTLILTDTQGLTTTMLFPAGAVTETVTLTLTPTVSTDGGTWVFAGHAFDLAAYRDDLLLPDFTFSVPVTVTIHYSDVDIRLINDESSLALWAWVGDHWQDAVQSCEPTAGYQREEGGNAISLAICRTGRFKLVGPTYPVFLPVISSPQ